MRDFVCPHCGQQLAFENSVCLSCDSPLGFSLDDMALLVIADGPDAAKPGFVDAADYDGLDFDWLVASGSRPRGLPNDCFVTLVHRAADRGAHLRRERAREMRGARRELRRDAAFLAARQRADTLEADRKYAERQRKILGTIAADAAGK